MAGIKVDILTRGTGRCTFRWIRPWPRPSYVKPSDDQRYIAVNFDDLIADFPSKKVSAGNPPHPRKVVALCFFRASGVREAEVVG
jgi:hypothetical protein